jgi:hypothetical protein
MIAGAHGVDAGRAATGIGSTINFRKDVFPILSQHCFRCHSGEKPTGNLSMSAQAALIKGGDSGPAVVPGDSGKSLLIHLVMGEGASGIMPPEGQRLNEKQIAVLRDWIDQGSTWDEAAAYRLELNELTVPAGQGNPIDRLLAAYATQHQLDLQPASNDGRFARRAALDVIGVPLPDTELLDFLADDRPNKRELLILRLLDDHDSYVAHWMSFWSDHLRIGSDVAAAVFDNDETDGPQKWLKNELVRNVPLDQFVHDLLAGDFFEQYGKSIAPTGEVASHVDIPEMQLSTTLSQVFLGIQLKCASCHDSFVDRWKLQDAWGLAAAIGDTHFDIYRCDLPTNQTAVPRFPLEGLGEIDASASKQQRRLRVADLMTKPQNGLFARTMVNRIWARLLGRGLVEPLDEMMEHEPWSPDLLDWLSGEFVRQKYDLKHLLYLIMTSQAYQSAAVIRAEPIKDKTYTFTGPEVRHLTAEQFLDSLYQLTVTKHDVNLRPIRAWQHENNRLMTMLGRPSRDVVVTVRESESTPLLALELINGRQLEEIIDQAAAAQSSTTTRAEIESHIFLTLLGRRPIGQERLLTCCSQSSSPTKEQISDFIWTILMLPEFQLIQ